MPTPNYSYYYDTKLQKLKPNPEKFAVYAPSAQSFKNVADVLDDYWKKKVSVLSPLGPVLVADAPFQTCNEVLKSKIPPDQYRAYPVLFSPSNRQVIVNGSWMVKFKPGIKYAQMVEICKNFDAYLEKPINEEERVYLARHTKSSESFFDKVNALYNSGNVEYAYPNFMNALVMEDAAVAPPDKNPLYQNHQQGLRSIKGDKAWTFLSNSTLPLSTVKVAVLDEGIMWDHKDLLDPVNGAKRVVNRLDQIKLVAGVCPNTDNHHGTSVAGIINAVNNGINMVGVAFDARLLDVRVARTNKSGNWESSEDAIVSGIYAAVSKGAKVINISWSWNLSTTGIKQAIQYALTNKVVVCCAAGNFTPGNTSTAIKFPALLAANTDVIAVGACDENGKWIDLDATTGFGSCYAASAQVVTLCAPGIKIPTLQLAHKDTLDFKGTSAAVAFVAGVVALVLSIKPGLTPFDVKDLLKKTAIMPPGGNQNQLGSGMVDALKAVS